MKNNLAEAEVSADLRFTGSDRSFGLLGKAQIDKGKVEFLDNKFELTSGIVTFESEQGVSANFDVNARTRVGTTDIFLDIRSEDGATQAFLSSQPVRDETNIISLLTLGADIEQLSKAAAEDQNLSSTLLPTVISGPFQSKVEMGLKKAKIVDSFQFVPYYSEDTKTTGLRMIVGKEVLPKFHVLYSTDLMAIDAENAVRLEQRVNNHFSVQGTLQENRQEELNDFDLGVDFELGFEF